MAKVPAPATTSTAIEFTLNELGDEFGLYRLPHETNAEFAHRLSPELEEMIVELRGTQTLIRLLLS